MSTRPEQNRCRSRLLGAGPIRLSEPVPWGVSSAAAADRAEARRAAAKFIRVWGAGDFALILAAVHLWQGFGATDIAAVNAQGSLLPLAK